jgi:uncharacterized SAM-binding protein YcdF (DUF218 family)
VIRRLLSLLRAGVCLAGAVLLIATFTPLARWIAAGLVVDWTDSDGDVLILLAGDDDPGLPSGRFVGQTTYWRTAYALDAWRSGHFRNLLICGAGSQQAIKPVLVAFGVPPEAILVEDRSRSTHENAAFARTLLAGRPGRSVLLTSDFHMLRASRCFAHEKIEVVTRPIPDVLKRSNTLRDRWACLCIVTGELGKLAYYRARGWI